MDLNRVRKLLANIDNEIVQALLKTIDKLEEENQSLKEDNYAYHQLMKMQNEREYRSKFLKDFQGEFGENVMPDYDEIYKRYDKQKRIIEKLKKVKIVFRKLRDVPDCLGNIDGVDYEADIPVKITTNEKLRHDVIEAIKDDPTISLNKEYHVIRITSYGDPFDVTIINDLGEEEQFGEWFFEDID